VIVFRHADRRFPFFWESADQPPGRWHGEGEGPVQYLAETADAAWAEFLRHEGITDAADLEGVARTMWAIDLPSGRIPRTRPRLSNAVLTGGESTYPACRAEARRLRARGARALTAPCAAVDRATPSGFRTDRGLVPGRRRRERVFVLFGAAPEVVGWAACAAGRPRDDLLPRIRHLR
jgi:hypothetical protein